MLQFEIKKVFSKFRNKVAMIILLIILIVTSILTMNRVEYIDSDGKRSSGTVAARNLRAEQNKWAGYLTEDVLADVVRENMQINNSKKALSDDVLEQDKAYAKKQGISDINNLIICAFSEWRDYNYYAIDNVSPEEAKQVYEKRISSLKGYLDSGEETFTDAQKNFLIHRYESLKTPFYYEYIGGWSSLLQNISTFILMLALVVGFFVSGIFSDEFQIKADSIFFSSKLGRNRAVSSKVIAGFLITTVLYVVFVLLYTIIVLLMLGADGANCPIQLDLWRSAYNVTFFQAYILIVAGGYVGTLFAAIISMIVSAAFRSTATAVIIPAYLLICLFLLPVLYHIYKKSEIK